MRIAETTRTRSLIALATVSTLALAGVFVASTQATSATPHARARTPITPMRGCGASPRVARPPAARPSVHPQGTTASFRDVLWGARDQLQACVTHGSVGYRLMLEIAPTGKVRSVEVKANADDLSKVDLKVVKCLETAASPLVFPQAPHEVRMSTTISAR